MTSAFRRVIHCDWSKHPGGRWSATACRDGAGWRARGPSRVPDGMPDFVKDLLDPAQGPTLAAFDFPIGLPLFLQEEMKCDHFIAALDRFGEDGPLKRTLDPADTLAEVSVLRPFYPDRPGAKGAKLREPWMTRLGANGMGGLLRACERGGDGSPEAGCMLWLTGAKGVGKAAIHGWTEVVRPALAGGAKLWPFEGDLPDLAARSVLALAESYPADACRQLGLGIRRKTDLAQRAALAPALMAWASARDVVLDSHLSAALQGGFPPGAGNDDGFDAVVGLLAAVAVARGERAAAPPLPHALRRWEGWILGKRGSDDHGWAASNDQEPPPDRPPSGPPLSRCRPACLRPSGASAAKARKDEPAEGYGIWSLSG